MEVISSLQIGVLREVFLTNHLASTDNNTKITNTHEPIVQYNNAVSIPNKRWYTMNTRKKILGKIERRHKITFNGSAYPKESSTLPEGPLGVFRPCLWPLKAPGCTLGEGRRASHRSLMPVLTKVPKEDHIPHGTLVGSSSPYLWPWSSRWK